MYGFMNMSILLLQHSIISYYLFVSDNYKFVDKFLFLFGFIVIFAALNFRCLIMMKSLYVYRPLLFFLAVWMVSLTVRAGDAAPPQPAGAMEFSFYGQELQAPRLNAVKVKSVCDYDVSTAWHDYQNRDVASVLESLRLLSSDMGLNDWFVFQLVRKYVDALLDTATPKDRVVLEHFLLVALGYDVRLARTEHQLLLLVPFEQEVYEQCFVKVNGKDYYLYYDDLEANEDERLTLHPCDPSKKDVGKGHALNLLFDREPLKVRSGEDKYCELDDGKIRFACNVNEGIMEMLRNYPLLDFRSYVTSVVMPQIQDSILGQMKPQLEDMTQCEAANALLHFVQHVFNYENDLESHGREKVYFIEENFYYDKNDCDDRSVLYAFLVRSLLDLDVQIVEYPGHECTAVHFTDCITYGSGYYVDGEFYLICDPSYVGAPIGRCMPKYRTIQPQVYVVKSAMGDANQSPLSPASTI